MDKRELTILPPKPLSLQHLTVWLMRARTVRAVIRHRPPPEPASAHPLSPTPPRQCPLLSTPTIWIWAMVTRGHLLCPNSLHTLESYFPRTRLSSDVTSPPASCWAEPRRPANLVTAQLWGEKQPRDLTTPLWVNPSQHEFSWWLRQQRICLQCRRPGFDCWVRKIPWRREWQPTPVSLPGESHGQRSLGPGGL